MATGEPQSVAVGTSTVDERFKRPFHTGHDGHKANQSSRAYQSPEDPCEKNRDPGNTCDRSQEHKNAQGSLRERTEQMQYSDIAGKQPTPVHPKGETSCEPCGYQRHRAG